MHVYVHVSVSCGWLKAKIARWFGGRIADQNNTSRPYTNPAPARANATITPHTKQHPVNSPSLAVT